MLGILCIVVVASAGLLTLDYLGFFNILPFRGRTVSFTIIEASSGPLEGMNGSAYYSFSTPWPVLNVSHGERVVIHVFNNSTSEPHGFSIVHYLTSGITISPQQSYDVVFIADTTGNFSVRCIIQCSVHPLMQNGLLTVK